MLSSVRDCFFVDSVFVYFHFNLFKVSKITLKQRSFEHFSKLYFADYEQVFVYWETNINKSLSASRRVLNDSIGSLRGKNFLICAMWFMCSLIPELIVYVFIVRCIAVLEGITLIYP